jgi:DNA adenine methylase
MTGTKAYGPALPDELGMTRLLLHAGRSSQATLNGRTEATIESLYLSPGLAEPPDRRYPCAPSEAKSQRR